MVDDKMKFYKQTTDGGLSLWRTNRFVWNEEGTKRKEDDGVFHNRSVVSLSHNFLISCSWWIRLIGSSATLAKSPQTYISFSGYVILCYPRGVPAILLFCHCILLKGKSIEKRQKNTSSVQLNRTLIASAGKKFCFQVCSEKKFLQSPYTL